MPGQEDSSHWETCSDGVVSDTFDSRPPSHAGHRPSSQASQAVKSLLPLRADVLLSNSLFEDLAEDSICESFLQYYTGATDLSTVRTLELQVDTVQENQQVEVLGDLLPNLDQLRLSQSAILTMRELGTGLTNLRVLYLSRCSLQDLGGVTALPVLEELYVSFNDICDLSPLCTHECIQVLDLEGNLVEDCTEVVDALQTVSTLRELTLSANPVMKSEDARAKLLNALPLLEVLDDIPREAAASPEPRHELGKDSLIDEHLQVVAQVEAELATAKSPPSEDIFEAEPTDWELVVESLRRGRRELAPRSVQTNGRTTSCGFRPATCGFRPATGGFRPATCFAPDRRKLRSSAGSLSLRPTTASSGVSTGLSWESTTYEDGESCASDLTTGGDGSPLAGNPLAAIRRRRHAANASQEDDIRNLLRKFEVAIRSEEVPFRPDEVPVTTDPEV